MVRWPIPIGDDKRLADSHGSHGVRFSPSSAASTPGSGQGSGGFRCSYLMRFQKVPVQRPCEVPEGFGGEDAWGGSGEFRCRDLVRFRRVLAEKMLGEVPESSGADTL